MAFIAPAIPYIIGISSAISAGSAIVQGRKARTEGKKRAELERTQAALEAQQADRLKYMRLGAIRAAHAKSGGAFGEGSVLDVLGDVAAQSELEKQSILAGGEARGSAYERAGKNEMTAGYLQAGSDLLAGTASTYDAFKRR